MRNFQFHSKGLPAIDPRFLDAEKEHLTMGHALPGKQTVVRLNDKQRQYLKKLFDKGTEKNQRKAVPAEVEKQMRHIKSPTGTGLLFTKDKWLSEDRIRNHFGRLAAQKRFRLTDADAATEAQVADASKNLEVAEHVQLQLDVQKNLEDEDKYSHPPQSGGINLCALIQSVITAKRPASSDINNYTIKELCLALKGIGNTSYKGKSRSKICSFFKDHVKEYCDCLEAFIE